LQNEYFKIYTVYCSNHGTAGTTLKKYLTTSNEFKALHDVGILFNFLVDSLEFTPIFTPII